jgi:hypothetical protein
MHELLATLAEPESAAFLHISQPFQELFHLHLLENFHCNLVGVRVRTRNRYLRLALCVEKVQRDSVPNAPHAERFSALESDVSTSFIAFHAELLLFLYLQQPHQLPQ